MKPLRSFILIIGLILLLSIQKAFAGEYKEGLSVNEIAAPDFCLNTPVIDQIFLDCMTMSRAITLARLTMGTNLLAGEKPFTTQYLTAYQWFKYLDFTEHKNLIGDLYESSFDEHYLGCVSSVKNLDQGLEAAVYTATLATDRLNCGLQKGDKIAIRQGPIAKAVNREGQSKRLATLSYNWLSSKHPQGQHICDFFPVIYGYYIAEPAALGGHTLHGKEFMEMEYLERDPGHLNEYRNTSVLFEFCYGLWAASLLLNYNDTFDSHPRNYIFVRNHNHRVYHIDERHYLIPAGTLMPKRIDMPQKNGVPFQNRKKTDSFLKSRPRLPDWYQTVTDNQTVVESLKFKNDINMLEFFYNHFQEFEVSSSEIPDETAEVAVVHYSIPLDIIEKLKNELQDSVVASHR